MFADRLRKLRLNKKLSQQYMANLLGITRQGYAKYEKAENGSQPDYDTLEKIANFFDVTIDYLLGRTEIPTTQDKKGSSKPSSYRKFSGGGHPSMQLDDDIPMANTYSLSKRDTLPGRRLSWLRRKVSKTQAEVANDLGFKNSNVLSRFETGEIKLNQAELTLFADYYGTSIEFIKGTTDEPGVPNRAIVSNQEISLTPEEARIFEELKKHPILFHDLASDPEKKIKELVKLYKMKKMFLEDDDEEYGDGFGDIED